ncbi:MAG: UPF0280 family protein [Firmicutes bacterium]|nr:UPF0280 family protein [Bacillota bacterium]
MKHGGDYVERTYRLLHRQEDLVFFRLTVKETDLDIGVPRGRMSKTLVEEARQAVLAVRSQLERYILTDREFLSSLEPRHIAPGAPEIARVMAAAGKAAGTGPMAAVAGAVAQHVGEYLARRTREVIVENGGDVYICSKKARRIGIFAGSSPFSNQIALEVEPHRTPLGICTSSGTVGHSLSLGRADAVVIMSPAAALADAVATAAGNLVKGEDDLQKVVNFALGINSVTGALVIMKDKLAAAGNIKLTPV